MSGAYRRALGALLISIGLSLSSTAIAVAQQQVAQSVTGEAIRLPPPATFAATETETPSHLDLPIDTQPNSAPIALNDSHSELWSGSLFRRLKDTTESADDLAPPAVQPVTWTALELAQRTVPQGIYAGADYLLLKPRMGEAVSFYSGGGGNTININANTYDFNYQSSPRVFLGYRNPETGSAIQFTYWHIQDISGNQTFTANGPNSGFIPNGPLFIVTGFENSPGDTISSQMKMQLNVYDIEFFKPVALSGGRWLLTGSIGARILDYRQSANTGVVDFTQSPTFLQQSNLQFTGAGPRAGFEARRIVGSNGALYVRGGYALLLGTRTTQVQATEIDNTFFPPLSQTFAIRETTTGVVSNADFELGGSWRFGDHMILSAGWMLAAFTDLGGAASALNLTNGGNMLSFDGLVARAAFSW